MTTEELERTGRRQSMITISRTSSPAGGSGGTTELLSGHGLDAHLLGDDAALDLTGAAADHRVLGLAK